MLLRIALLTVLQVAEDDHQCRGRCTSGCGPRRPLYERGVGMGLRTLLSCCPVDRELCASWTSLDPHVAQRLSLMDRGGTRIVSAPAVVLRSCLIPTLPLIPTLSHSVPS